MSKTFVPLDGTILDMPELSDFDPPSTSTPQKHPPPPEAHICDYCGVHYLNRTALKEHRKTHELARYTCEVCTKTFQIKSHYEDHASIHQQQKNHTCEKCAKQYFSRISLKKHQDRCVRDINFLCEKCNASFSSYSVLYNHQVRKHARNRFTCKCGKTVKYKQSLKRHQEKCEVHNLNK